ncbi:hypothetical protein CALVIDRAFT_228273 [Calocera viscosa TUFC12733]|uniref:Uncharacterized protein n=1 Tax=Calocera viscosa (strain TUFC12733) TaxID=1330018 RepID=A0A167K3Z5_CALVF|nr:hypothetical protein CALVIDRAFT_228273 [Calocera viscosa TUFC12733]
MREVLRAGGNRLMRTDHVQKIDKARAEPQISFLHLFPLPPSRLMGLGIDVSALCGSYRRAPGCSWLPSRVTSADLLRTDASGIVPAYNQLLWYPVRASESTPSPSFPSSAVSPSSVPPPIRPAARSPHQALAGCRNVLPHLRVDWPLRFCHPGWCALELPLPLPPRPCYLRRSPLLPSGCRAVPHRAEHELRPSVVIS